MQKVFRAAVDQAAPHEWAVQCPSGKKALGGGFSFGVTFKPSDQTIQASKPTENGDGWVVSFFTENFVPMQVYAICAAVD